jgi:hypothetical protein
MFIYKLIYFIFGDVNMGRKEYLLNTFRKTYLSLNNPDKELVLQKALDELKVLPELDKNLIV